MSNLPEYKRISTESLIPYSMNSRVHSDAQVEQLVDSIREFGFTNPILIDSANNVIAGHCRIAAAKKIGINELPCIVIDGLTEDQKRAYIIADNKLALNASWDFDILLSEVRALQDSSFDIELTGFSLEEIADLMPEIENKGLCDADDVPDIDDAPKTKAGDIWILGDHRLMCGNSKEITHIEMLMDNKKADMVFTDPPYNTGMTSQSQKGSGGFWKGNNGSTRLSHIFDDCYTPEEWQDFMASFMASYWMLTKENCVLYICLDWRRNHELIPHIENVGFKRSNLIVWDKMVHGLGSDYKYTHEFINVCKKGKPALDTHQGDDREYSDVWHIQRKMGRDEDHATKKPIELVERALRHASKRDDLVVDLFGGSGSTLIACEKTNRKCFMMEIMPSYCDVIIKRWQKFTGKDAILESNNIKFNEV